MLYKTLSLKSFSILAIQGKRALKKDAAKRKPSEVKSQIEVLTTASLLHQTMPESFFWISLQKCRIWSWAEETTLWRRLRGDQARVKEVSHCAMLEDVNFRPTNLYSMRCCEFIIWTNGEISHDKNNNRQLGHFGDVREQQHPDHHRWKLTLLYRPAEP